MARASSTEILLFLWLDFDGEKVQWPKCRTVFTLRQGRMKQRIKWRRWAQIIASANETQ